MQSIRVYLFQSPLQLWRCLSVVSVNAFVNINRDVFICRIACGLTLRSNVIVIFNKDQQYFCSGQSLPRERVIGIAQLRGDVKK